MTKLSNNYLELENGNGSRGPERVEVFFSEVVHYLSIREDTRSGTNELDLDRIKELLDVLRHIFKELIHRSVGESIILHRLYKYAANS